MPDGIVLNLCKTCTKVKAVLVPVPPCLIFRTASQTWSQPKRVWVEREKEGALGRDEKRRMVGLYANSPVLTAGTPSPIPFRVFLRPILFLLLAGVACGNKKERVRERRARGAAVLSCADYGDSCRVSLARDFWRETLMVSLSQA